MDVFSAEQPHSLRRLLYRAGQLRAESRRLMAEAERSCAVAAAAIEASSRLRAHLPPRQRERDAREAAAAIEASSRLRAHLSKNRPVAARTLVAARWEERSGLDGKGVAAGPPAAPRAILGDEPLSHEEARLLLHAASDPLPDTPLFRCLRRALPGAQWGLLNWAKADALLAQRRRWMEARGAWSE
jgi:hypothetical protein